MYSEEPILLSETGIEGVKRFAVAEFVIGSEGFRLHHRTREEAVLHIDIGTGVTAKKEAEVKAKDTSI